MKYLGSPSSGSYQGMTHSRNRNGQYVRSRAVPVQPRSTYQTNVRARLAEMSAAFRSLTDYERLAWGALGLLISRTDALGQSYTLTGAQTHVSVNSVLSTYGQSTLDEPPLLATPSAPGSIDITAVAGTEALSVSVGTEPSTGFLGFYASPPQTQGRTFMPAGRLIATFPVGGSPYNLLLPWKERFGVLISGQKITISVRSMQDGFESIGASASAIVA